MTVPWRILAAFAVLGCTANDDGTQRQRAAHAAAQTQFLACYESATEYVVVNEATSAVSCLPRPLDWPGYTPAEEIRIRKARVALRF